MTPTVFDLSTRRLAAPYCRHSPTLEGLSLLFARYCSHQRAFADNKGSRRARYVGMACHIQQRNATFPAIVTRHNFTCQQVGQCPIRLKTKLNKTAGQIRKAYISSVLHIGQSVERRTSSHHAEMALLGVPNPLIMRMFSPRISLSFRFFVLNAIVFGFILPLEESKVDPLAKIAFI